ncbi:MAG: ATP-binding protein, partial [Mycobacteriales bacterium]
DALFGDFRQVDASATRRVGGLGLGLSFVRRVATAFGFTADVESSPGKGSLFWLDLPVAKPARATRAARPRSHA